MVQTDKDNGHDTHPHSVEVLNLITASLGVTARLRAMSQPLLWNPILGKTISMGPQTQFEVEVVHYLSA
jgi:hypothetical protein